MDDTNTNDTSYNSSTGTKKSNKTVLWVIIALIALVLGGGGGYVWGQTGKQREVDRAKEATRKEEAKKHAASQAANDADRQKASVPAKLATGSTCNADELSLEAVQGADSGAGTMAYDLVLTNTGKRTCALGGFPGVSLVSANGNMVGEAAERANNYTEKQVSLAPGMKAKAVVSMENSSNFDAGKCKAGATKIRVYPPDDTGYLSVATPVDTWCPGMMISPMLAM